MKTPKNHKVWVTYEGFSTKYIITSLEKNREKYYLWKEIDKKWEKIGQSENPKKLEEKILKVEN